MKITPIEELYIPTLQSMLHAMGTDKETFESTKELTVPAGLFRLLVQIALASSEFNEEGYLRDNPDIRAAVALGTIPDAFNHYVGHGFFEARTGATPELDEQWYLANYPDVAGAIRDGSLPSAKSHYDAVGASEGRSPTARHQFIAQEWKRAFEG